jgi:hypothetical protein
VLGSAWWDRMRVEAANVGWCRTVMWAAVGVEAAHRWCLRHDS